mmetsp:Transcript_23717/g.23409  ORF Transcript_23717/g.23409 Transcript_23717/m.23409 type:complete len:90 (+) Transcript_23717:346-615(+)
MRFTSDNKFLICTSMNAKETGGGLIYVIRVEHAVDQVKVMNKKINEMRNVQGTIIIDSVDQELRPRHQTSNLSQEEFAPVIETMHTRQF